VAEAGPEAVAGAAVVAGAADAVVGAGAGVRTRDRAWYTGLLAAEPTWLVVYR
jgi:hypothetical protein